MGLDNGIEIRTNKTLDVTSPWVQVYHFSTEYSYEFLYWRKWWGFRNEVIDYLVSQGHNGMDSSFELTLENIIEIYNIFIKYEDKDYWYYNADSVWEYEDIDFELYKNKFLYLIAFYIAHPTEKIIFYDSY